MSGGGRWFPGPYSWMGRVYQRAAQEPRVVVFADGEDERVLRAVRAALDERMIRRPHVIGRLEVVTRVAANLNLGFKVIERSRADAEQSLGAGAALPKEAATDDGLDILRVVDMSVGPGRYRPPRHPTLCEPSFIEFTDIL